MTKQHFITDVIIGLEVHCELDTQTKLFCSCAREGSEEPNTRTCETCLGHPGNKPVLNEKAVEFAVKLCLATNSEISPILVFSRKSYFYPDMSKNYQITQYELPLGRNGKIKLSNGKEIRLIRIHMEEDPASLVHPAGMRESGYVLVDYNRSGNPLVEIVTEPDLASADEARDFMKKIVSILTYLEIFDVNKCIIKADANISVKESGYTRVEIKNITGFKEIERALEYEINRQKKEISEGDKIHQETRAWDSEKGITHSLRKKEAEEDYGYIIDPDLVVTDISDEYIDKIKESLPELAEQKISKFLEKHGIKKEDAEILAAEKELAELYERVAEEINPELAAKWLRRELMRVVNYANKTLKEIKVDEKNLIALLELIEKKKITDKVGQKLMEMLIEKPFDVKEYVKKEKLEALADISELEEICKQTIQESPKAVEDYKAGKLEALNFIVGRVMQKTRRKADPNVVRKLILEKIVSQSKSFYT